MKLYEVKKGTLGIVYPPGKQPTKKDFKVRKDLVFEDHEMIFDPITLANGGLKKASNWCRMMARKGYAGFRRENYLLVVNYKKVKVVC